MAITPTPRPSGSSVSPFDDAIDFNAYAEVRSVLCARQVLNVLSSLL
jgi:hypothetical protein